MNNFDKLNDIITYIESNLTNEISLKKICQILCVNEYTLYRIFSFITGFTLTEYIRNRRLSMAGLELLNSNIKIIDLSTKYGYDSPVAFSRAFKKFHGIKPSEVNGKSKYLKNIPPLTFTNNFTTNITLDYKIEEKDELCFYTISQKCNIQDLKTIAANSWKEIENQTDYRLLFDETAFGIIEYDEYFPIPKTVKYHLASQRKFCKSTKFIIPKSTWAIFNVTDRTSTYMSNLSLYVYKNWIPYSGYNIRNLPEIELYHDDYTQWWLPIEPQEK